MKKILSLATGLCLLGTVSIAQNTANAQKSTEKKATQKSGAMPAANSAPASAQNANAAAPNATPAAGAHSSARPAAANRANGAANSNVQPVSNATGKPADVKAK